MRVKTPVSHDFSLSFAAVALLLVRNDACALSQCCVLFYLVIMNFSLLSSVIITVTVNWYSGCRWHINMRANKVIPLTDLLPTSKECGDVKKIPSRVRREQPSKIS